MEKVVKIKLSEPFEAMSGITVTELTADFSKIRVRDVAMVNRLERRLKGSNDELDITSVTKSASPEWRAAYSWCAVLKATPGVVYDDIDRLSIPDYMELSSISLPFVVKT